MSTERHSPGEPGPEGCGKIHAETQDLKQLIKLAVKQRKYRRPGQQANPLLFLAPKVSPLPASVLDDRTLTHREKLLWLHLRSRLGSTNEHTLPWSRELAECTDIGGRTTITRSFSMLRCRRYLSVCATAWHGGGRKVGTAYALHAPRLLVADAIFLDPEYPAFVQHLQYHPYERLRNAAGEEVLALSAC